jgi:hypothetical protein
MFANNKNSNAVNMPEQPCPADNSYHVTIWGEHKVFPWLQTFITKKLCGIQTYATVT